MDAPLFATDDVTILADSRTRSGLLTTNVRCRRLEVHDDGLFLDGQLAVSCDEIRGGRIESTSARRTVVQLDAAGRVYVRIAIKKRSESRALLAALERSARSRVERIHVDGETPIPWVLMLALLVLAVGAWAIGPQAVPVMVGVGVCLIVFFVIASQALPPPHAVTLAKDGLMLRVAKEPRYIPYDRIALVESSYRTVVLVLTSGGKISIPLWTPSTERPQRQDRQLAAYARIAREDSLATRLRAKLRARGPAEKEESAPRERTPESLLLSKGAGSTRDWLKGLDALGRSDNYRAAEIPEETLWRIAEDEAEDASARAAALFVLRRRVEVPEDERANKIVASATPRIRVALEAAAAGDATRLEATAAELDAQADAADDFTRWRGER